MLLNITNVITREHAYLHTWFDLQQSDLGQDFSQARVNLAIWLTDERKRVLERIYKTAGIPLSSLPVCYRCRQHHC